MGIFSKIFGSDKAIDAGISGIDKMFYTDEEKSDNKMKFLKLYEPFKIAQRYIAMVFCPVYALGWIATFVIEIIDIFMEKDLNTETLYSLLQGDFAMMVILILGFYFAGGAAEGMLEKRKK